MVTPRVILGPLSFAIVLSTGLAVSAQTADIQKTLESKYVLTKPTADRSDIVTAGDVIVLQKDGLVMCGVTTSVPSQNVYKNGKVTQSVLNKARFMSLGSFAGPSSSAGTRTFVTGEKFWITNIETRDDGVAFTLMSDPISDTRYYAVLKIPFNKGAAPPPTEVASLADQLFKVQPADNSSGGSGSSGGGGGGPAPASAVSAAPPAAPMAPIAPPPPPADAAAVPPPTIKIGQTKAEVTAMFGAPTKVVKLSTKEIDYFPDMKVTFVHDKVSDVE